MTSDASPPRIAPGTRIDHYEVVGWLGAGGMGVVYRAHDSRLGRDVAIKLISDVLSADPGRVSRFEQEARAAGQLNHPNILAVYDVGRHAGAPYIVSELLEGESLRSRLQNGALPPRRALDYARQIAEGLAAAHERNMVHRDVKPDNLFVTKDGRVKILDFGVAKLTRPSDDSTPYTGLPTETAAGFVVGTATYMSPEQVRGETVDPRSDIFSFGAVLYEMLAGHAAFRRETAPETMTAILKDDPPALAAADVPPSLQRIVSRCLEKTREMRFQSARDLAFGLEVLSDSATAIPAAAATPRRWPMAAAVAIVAALAIGVGSWLKLNARPSFASRLARATFTPFTNFEGSEEDAAISPDGRFVVFIGDQAGTFHIWLKQVGAGDFQNLTPDAGDQRDRGPVRNVGFTAHGLEIWDHGDNRMKVRPLTGGAPRLFLGKGAVNVAWSPDGSRLVYFTAPRDVIFVADGTGGNPRQIFVGGDGDHHHFPAWSQDGEWIYYAGSTDSLTDFDIYRIRPAGGQPQRLTTQARKLKYITPIDDRTILFVSLDEDGAGPWLYALDVRTRIVERASVGLERYLSVAATADGRRLVASVATQAAALWSVPILDHVVVERDVEPYRVPTPRALAPRFAKDSLFYLSTSGPGDGLWRVQAGKAAEIWRGSDEALTESPAVSPQGDRVAVVRRVRGKSQLALVSADGADHRSFAEGLDVRGTCAWSPDAKWIVTGGVDAKGPGLFKIPVAGGEPERIATGPATDPVWSPDGEVIVYAGLQIATAPLLAVTPNGTAVPLPEIRIPSGGGGRFRFLPRGRSLIYLAGVTGEYGFWRLDMPSNTTMLLAQLASPSTMSTFDITPDGKRIVFDRLRENADIRLIDLPK